MAQWAGLCYTYTLLGYFSHEPELDQNDDISDSDGDHRGKCAPLNSEQPQAGHWSCLFHRHGTSGGCNWSFETALPLLPRYWACMIVEMERLMVGDWICVEV